MTSLPRHLSCQLVRYCANWQFYWSVCAVLALTALFAVSELLLGRGDVVAAINLSGPEAVMDSPVARERYRESLQQCADAISLELGAQERR